MIVQRMESETCKEENENDIIIDAAKNGKLELIKSFSSQTIRNAKCGVGCTALHWAAGSNQIHIVHYLLSTLQQYGPIFTNVDVQVESKLAKGRTPLHYACRNGHLETVKVLIETYYANPNAKARQGVTPFQLAIWQNHLNVCMYLVDKCGVRPCDDVNDFGCGAIHWLGIIPAHRANLQKDQALCTESSNQKSIVNEDGDSLMPLAKWLTSQPNIDITAKQNQGHTVLHKAAWGGHLALVKYLHEMFGMYDDSTDIAGNYAADLCDMMNTERHQRVALYLRRECSLERIESYNVLGLKIDASPEEIRKAYLEKARVSHPDVKLIRNKNNIKENSKHESDIDSFDRIYKAYKHLTIGKGIATKQKNPAHSINLLLEMQDLASFNNSEKNIYSDKENLFKARLLAVLFEYGDKGVYLSNIPKKWDQVWPTVPLESYFPKEKRKPGALLELIKSHAGDVVRIVRKKPNSEIEQKSSKGAIVIIPRNISRDDVLKFAADNDII